jgi:uncharacterized membrane protein YgcG
MRRRWSSILYIGRLLIFSAFSFICQEARAQLFAPTEQSTRFLTDEVADSILFEAFTAYGLQQGLSPADLRDRYQVMRPQVAEMTRAVTGQAMRDLDRRYRDLREGDPGYAKATLAYLNAFQDGVRRMLSSSAPLYPLFVRNESDRILSFHAEINVERSGVIRVEETIRIYNGNGATQPAIFDATLPSPNNDIQRGIVRDFPTMYQDSSGLWQKTGFALGRVLKNGKEEPFLLESLANGKRVKLGRAEVILDTGVYVYQLSYETSNQLIFHPDKDELYWNVNGNGWVFTADTVTCSLHFPEGSEVLEFACYTGPMGSTERACRMERLSNRHLFFSADNRLAAYEGLTIAASIQKGILQPPSGTSRFLSMLRTNYVLPVMLLGFLLMTVYYVYFWWKKGRDPRKGTIIPQLAPPDGISPAEAGYLLRQGFHPSLFAATLVDAAVHRHLDIEVEKTGTIFKTMEYRFRKPVAGGTMDSSVMANRYGIPIASLYGLDAQRGKYNPAIKSLFTQLEAGLRKSMQVRKSRDGRLQGYFALNRGYLVPGFLILLACFITGFFFTVNAFSKQLFIFSLVLFLLMVAVHIIFSIIMKAYTKEGRALTDHILGFRMYLDTAEQQLFQYLTPPEKTLDLFEKYLPYAIALNVENSWADKFSDIMANAIAAGYQPAYYRGNLSSFAQGLSMSDISSGISSGLSSTISSASTPPSSSSGGSGGGGSSGGGGGGGGGGGW